MRLHRLLARLLVGLALGALAARAAAPDEAQASDPFGFLEDAGDPQTQVYLRHEAELTERALERLPGRNDLEARIRALSRSGTTVSALALAGSRVFYLKLEPERMNPVLCVRNGLDSAERVLVDPERFTREGKRAAIDWFVPSPEAHYVAYGISYGGSGDSVLRVVATDTGSDLPLAIDRARFNARLAWHPDGRSFYYTRLPETPKEAPSEANMRIYRHLIGRESASDEVVFAPGVGGAIDVPRIDYPYFVVPADSRYAYAIAREGVRPEIAVHVTEQKDLAKARPRWRKIVGVQDAVTAIEAWKDDLYLLSHRGAPRYRVLQLNASQPDLAHARVVVPQGDAVIQSMGLAADALYLRTMLGGVDRLERLPIGLFGKKAAQFLRIPFDTAISELVTHPRRPGALLRLEGWIEPAAIVQVEAQSGNLRATRLQPPGRAPDFSAMDEVRLYAPGHDGTRIPVTLLYKKSTTLNADNPTLLVGYGAYGATPLPQFDPARLAWLERGAIYAIAHVRGGGEYGETWHAAGRQAAKVNTVLDFIAVAEYLVRYGFTKPQRLAIEGSGAGGVAVGGALVRRPDLFAAVVARAPLMDMLRYERLAHGAAIVPEFGSSATAEGLEALRSISPYHQVKEATAYPAVLLTAGMNDWQVESWQPAKMAARLQSASASGKPVLLRVDFEAGHERGASRAQRESELADIYAFLLWQLGEANFQPPAAPAPVIP